MTADDGERGSGGAGGGRGGADGRRRWGLRVAAGAAVVVLLAVVGRALVPGTSGTSGTDGDRERPKLHRWDLVGCYDLRVGPWRASWRGESAGPGAGRGGRTPGSGESPGTGSRPTADGRGLEVPASFRPPARLRLLPDSVDRWGRALPSRRAVPLDGDGRPGRSLRWTVHGDTLWLVWSEGDTRAGVALRRAGDSLAGRVRTVRGGDSLDATASASARRINCSTRAPERFPGRGRLDRR